MTTKEGKVSPAMGFRIQTAPLAGLTGIEVSIALTFALLVTDNSFYLIDLDSILEGYRLHPTRLSIFVAARLKYTRT